MRQILTSAGLLLIICTRLNAGPVDTVLFDPHEVEVTPGEIAQFDVTLFAATLGDIQGADILFWSDGTAFDFAYSSVWLDSMAYVTWPGPASIYSADTFAGGANPAGPIGSDTILFGTITVDTTGLQVGETDVIQVDGNRDGLSAVLLGSAAEPAVGMGTLHVVPEPHAFLLAGVGLLAAVFRRTRCARRQK